MKRVILSIILTLSLTGLFADTFTDAIQDLAIQTACVGMYSMTEASGGWYEDPHDWYTPQDMAERFAKMSGDMTRTTTFYGVCFDYAQFAFNDVKKYADWYRQQGLYENQFWMAGVHENYNTIELMSPGTASDHTRKQNGVYIKTYSSSNRSVKTHKRLDGTHATHHAWLWIQRADDVWFWIDPTWTDNLGYVVYGCVANGEEIQCRPDPKLCKKYPEYLNTLPLPPAMGQRKAPSKTVNSTNRQETIGDAMSDFIVDAFDKKMRKTFIDVNYSGMNDYIGILLCASVPFESIIEKEVTPERMAFGMEFPYLHSSGAILIGGEYVQNLTDGNALRGGLFEFDFTRRLINNITWYIGGGVGLRFDNKEKYYASSYITNTGYFAWKADTGFILNLGNLFSKIEVSFDNVTGFSAGAGIGFGLRI